MSLKHFYTHLFRLGARTSHRTDCSAAKQPQHIALADVH